MKITHLDDRPPVRRWSLALFLSVALNLLLAGVVASDFLRPASPPGAGHTTFVLERLASTLPQTDAGVLREEWAARGPAIESSETAARQARETIRAALRAEPFDGAALNQAMTAFRDARTRQHETLQGVLRAAVARMTLAGRLKLAEWPERH